MELSGGKNNKGILLVTITSWIMWILWDANFNLRLDDQNTPDLLEYFDVNIISNKIEFKAQYKHKNPFQEKLQAKPSFSQS